jgi:hypothetical protein
MDFLDLVHPRFPMSGSRVFVALVLTFTWQFASATAGEPISVTVKQLLSSPTEFDGKQVSVIGYYVNSFETGSHLFANAKTSKNLNGANLSVDQSVLFNPGTALNPAPPLIGISDVCELTKHYVRIIGRFRCREGNGRRRLELMNIMNFRVAAITPDDPINPCGMYHNK